MSRGRTFRRRRPDGTWSRWIAVIDAPRQADGRRRQVTQTFDTRREAEEWLARQATHAVAVATDGLTVGQWLEQWVDDQPYARPSTRATYRAHIERHLKPALGQETLAGLDATRVEELVGRLAAQGLAPASIHRIMATLRSALGEAVRRRLVPGHPMAGVRLPSIPARLQTIWDPKDAARFLASCDRSGIGVLFRVALTTGLRRGELLGLRWADVDADPASVRVQSSRVALGSEVVTGAPKTRSGVRRVFLDQDTARALGQWRWTQARLIGPNDGLAFTHANGEPFQPWWVSRAFDRHIDTVGLPRIRFHDLRHSSATLGLAAGETLKEVSVRLGHSDIGITANVYSEVLPQTAQASSERRARLMRDGDVRVVEVAS